MGSVEVIKQESAHLRGTIGEELAQDSTHFGKEDVQVLKFHGVYQAEDRDQKKERKKAGLEPAWEYLVRVKIPGGELTAKQLLALHQLTDLYGNGNLRITSRQGIQYHNVSKDNLKPLLQGIDDADLTTWGACGDVARNIMATAAPFEDSVHREVRRLSHELTEALAARQDAYHEAWLDGEKKTQEPKEHDPLYGEFYLPRKFKIGIAVPPRNDVDIYTQDLSFVPYFPNGEVEGYTVVVGGGQGMPHQVLKMSPMVAQSLFYVEKQHVVETARAVLSMHRDYGSRKHRKRSRLKYVVADNGMPWFRAEMERRLSFKPSEAKFFTFDSIADALGWHEQCNGRYFCGVRVLTGRIQDDEKLRLRSAVREILERFDCPVTLTGNHNILFSGLREEDREPFDRILEAHGVPLPSSYTRSRLSCIACPALPTCSLAFCESERVFPAIMDEIDVILRENLIEKEPILFRMTGCPNGCTRPYVADFGIVGSGADKYSIYVGGSIVGDRLGSLVHEKVPLAGIVGKVRPILEEYAENRFWGESFSDYWMRTRSEEYASDTAPIPLGLEMAVGTAAD